jgi:hypothetical protein
MAELTNDAGTMRWNLEVVDREAPVRGPIQVVMEDGRVPSGRLVATTAVEYFDPRDRQFWPFIRLPSLYLAPADLQALLTGVTDLCSGSAPGFAWRSGADGAVGVQVGGGEGAPAAVVAEIGVDLAIFLEVATGAPRRPGAELALFRFLTGQAQLVRFGDQLKGEFGGLTG